MISLVFSSCICVAPQRRRVLMHTREAPMGELGVPSSSVGCCTESSSSSDWDKPGFDDWISSRAAWANSSRAAGRCDCLPRCLLRASSAEPIGDEGSSAAPSKQLQRASSSDCEQPGSADSLRSSAGWLYSSRDGAEDCCDWLPRCLLRARRADPTGDEGSSAGPSKQLHIASSSH